MNNPGMDLEIWKQLRKKWTGLDAKGHKLKIDFQLISHPTDKKKILAIDVIQHIDKEMITETVQRVAGEGYEPLGIAGLSREQLVEVLKELMKQLHSQSKLNDIDAIVTMSLTSPTSGELRAHLEVPDAPVQSSILVDYRYYYVLNALREKMMEQTGKSWKRVVAVYHAGSLEFDFAYS